MKVVIKLQKEFKINRINIFAYPTETNVYPDENARTIDYKIEYATDENLTNWVAWSGLEDRSEEIGQTPTTISNGQTSGNLNTYNSFHDKEGVNAYGVRVTPIGEGEIKFTEIEVWQSLEMNDINSFILNSGKDIVSNKTLASAISGTWVVEAKDYMPNKGEFKDVSSDDITQMRARVYGGYSEKGNEIWTIMGHFVVSNWTTFLKSKKIEFILRDRVKWLLENNVKIGEAEILKNKTREYIIEWLGLKANIHSAEMDLFKSGDSVPFFYPLKESNIWDEMNEVAQALADIDLYFDKYNKLNWKVYLDNIPHFWEVKSIGDFENCNLTNLQTDVDENGEIFVRPAGVIEPQEIERDTSTYESDPLILGWQQVQEFSYIHDETLKDLILQAEVCGSFYAINEKEYVYSGRLKVEIQAGIFSFEQIYEGGGASRTGVIYKLVQDVVDMASVPDGTNVNVKFYIETSTYSGTTIRATTGLRNILMSRRTVIWNGGELETYVKDLVDIPSKWGTLVANFTGFSPEIYIAVSDDGVNFSDWVLYTDEIIAEKKQYVKIKVIFPSANLLETVPKLYSIGLSWFSGEGDELGTNVLLSVSDDDIEELPLSYADNKDGQTIQYDKVEVVMIGFVLKPQDKVWEGEVGWTTESGQKYTYNIELEYPVEIDDDFVLVINGITYERDVEIIEGGLKVKLTSHYLRPKVEIEQESVPVSITEFYLMAKQYKPESKNVVSAGTGTRVYRIENKYLNTPLLAKKIANKIYNNVRGVKERIFRDMGVLFFPVAKIRGLINIYNEEFGITKQYEVSEFRHEFNLMGEEVAKTFFKIDEIDYNIYYDPLYWGTQPEGEVAYFGANAEGEDLYWGGNAYG